MSANYLHDDKIIHDLHLDAVNFDEIYVCDAPFLRFISDVSVKFLVIMPTRTHHIKMSNTMIYKLSLGGHSPESSNFLLMESIHVGSIIVETEKVMGAGGHKSIFPFFHCF